VATVIGRAATECVHGGVIPWIPIRDSVIEHRIDAFRNFVADSADLLDRTSMWIVEPQSRFSPFHVAGHTSEAEQPMVTTRSIACSSSGSPLGASGR